MPPYLRSAGCSAGLAPVVGRNEVVCGAETNQEHRQAGDATAAEAVNR